MAGQVLDISKHENSARTLPPQRPGRTARIYRFPAGKCIMPATPAAPARKSNLRTHLIVEVAIGLLLWLIWFIWHLLN